MLNVITEQNHSSALIIPTDVQSTTHSEGKPFQPGQAHMCSQSVGHYLINTSRQSMFALKMTSSVQRQPDRSVRGEVFNGCVTFMVGKSFRKEKVEKDAEK